MQDMTDTLDLGGRGRRTRRRIGAASRWSPRNLSLDVRLPGLVVHRPCGLDVGLDRAIAVDLHTRPQRGPQHQGRGQPLASARLVLGDARPDKGQKPVRPVVVGRRRLRRRYGLGRRLRPVAGLAVDKGGLFRKAAIGVVELLDVVGQVHPVFTRRKLHGQALRLERRSDLRRAFEPGSCQGLRVQQNRRHLPEQVGLRPAALGCIELGRHQAAARIPVRDPALAQLFLDSPLRQAMAVEDALGHFRLLCPVLQASQQPGLPQGDLAGLQSLQGDGREPGQGRKTAYFDLPIAQGAGDDLHAQSFLQHPADGGDDVGDVDRGGGVGQDDRRGLALPVRLDEDLHGMIGVDETAVTQQPERQQPATPVQDHVGGFVAQPGPHGRKLQEAGGVDGIGQLRNVVVRRLAIAEVLGGDVEVAETDDGLAACRCERPRG
ncbi:hypothetical protein D3C86_1073680 [compost metagenome]